MTPTPGGSQTELYDPAASTWTGASGSLATARAFHTATLLPNGYVLVAGGYRSGRGYRGYLSSAELYDPTVEAWVDAGRMTTERTSHTATLLPNGKVLVVGGFNVSRGYGANLRSAELYDPTAGTWRATSKPNTARGGHTATLLPDGKVLVAGGANTASGDLSSAELYDPETGTWSLTGSLAAARERHTATLLPSGKVLVVGGYARSEFLRSAELYDPALGTWVATGSMITARRDFTATLLPDGEVLVAGGYDGLASAELYDPVTGTWRSTGGLTTPRASHAAVLLPNGKVLVAGGYNAASGELTSAELYDPAASAWRSTGSLSHARAFHTATLLPNGEVLVAGGTVGVGFLASTDTRAPSPWYGCLLNDLPAASSSWLTRTMTARPQVAAAR